MLLAFICYIRHDELAFILLFVSTGIGLKVGNCPLHYTVLILYIMLDSVTCNVCQRVDILDVSLLYVIFGF